jgi:hypothetical protein
MMLGFIQMPDPQPIHPQAQNVRVRVLNTHFDKLSPLLKEAAIFLKNNVPKSHLYDEITIAARPMSAVRAMSPGEPERYGLGVVIHAVVPAPSSQLHRTGLLTPLLEDLQRQIEQWIAMYWRGPVAMDDWDEGLNVVLFTERDLKPWLPNGYYEGVRDTLRLA